LEEVLGGIESLSLAKWGFGLRGYAIYVTKERIIGAKMKERSIRLVRFIFGSKSRAPINVEWINENGFISSAKEEKAERIISDVEKRKDFEAKKETIVSIVLEKPKIRSPGFLEIKTVSGKLSVLISADAIKDFNHLKKILKEFHPHVLKIEE